MYTYIYHANKYCLNFTSVAFSESPCLRKRIVRVMPRLQAVVSTVSQICWFKEWMRRIDVLEWEQGETRTRRQSRSQSEPQTREALSGVSLSLSQETGDRAMESMSLWFCVTCSRVQWGIINFPGALIRPRGSVALIIFDRHRFIWGKCQLPAALCWLW